MCAPTPLHHMHALSNRYPPVCGVDLISLPYDSQVKALPDETWEIIRDPVLRLYTPVQRVYLQQPQQRRQWQQQQQWQQQRRQQQWQQQRRQRSTSDVNTNCGSSGDPCA